MTHEQSTIISAVELGDNFGDKIARFYRLIKSRDKFARLTPALDRDKYNKNINIASHIHCGP